MQSTIVRGFAQTLHSHHRQKWQSYQRIFRALGRLTTTKWCRMDQSRYWSYAKPTKCARSGFHSTAIYPTICRFSKLTYLFSVCRLWKWGWSLHGHCVCCRSLQHKILPHQSIAVCIAYITARWQTDALSPNTPSYADRMHNHRDTTTTQFV